MLAATARAGIAGDAILHGLGLVAGDFDLPGFVLSHANAYTVVRRALRLLNEPDIGLTLGMETRVTERGAMALGLMAAATLGDSIALALQFPRSAGSLMAVHAERGESLHVVIAKPVSGNDDIAPFLVDIMFAGSVRMRRQVSDSHYAPAMVELSRPRPPNVNVYERHFACPVHFGRRQNALSTSLVGLDYPLPLANVMAYRLSRQLLDRELERGDVPSALRHAVERAIRRALPLAASPAELARSLNLSERTLRRRLAQEGLTFRGLLDEARKTLALELIGGARRSIAEIALETGFSDARAFSRAFRRWTGEQPSASFTAAQPQADEAGVRP